MARTHVFPAKESMSGDALREWCESEEGPWQASGSPPDHAYAMMRQAKSVIRVDTLGDVLELLRSARRFAASPVGAASAGGRAEVLEAMSRILTSSNTWRVGSVIQQWADSASESYVRLMRPSVFHLLAAADRQAELSVDRFVVDERIAFAEGTDFEGMAEFALDVGDDLSVSVLGLKCGDRKPVSVRVWSQKQPQVQRILAAIVDSSRRFELLASVSHRLGEIEVFRRAEVNHETASRIRWTTLRLLGPERYLAAITRLKTQ